MDNQRLFLLAALGLIGFLLYQAWVEDYGPQPQTATVAEQPAQQANKPLSSGTPGNEVPTLAPGTPTGKTATTPATGAKNATTTMPSASEANTALANAPTVRVRTDVLDVHISLRGGTLREVELRDYEQSLEDDAPPVELLSTDPAKLFVMQSGLRGYGEAPAPDHTALYQSAQNDYQLQPGDDKITVSLQWQDAGLIVIKTYTFQRNSYQVGLDYQVRTTNNTVWQGDAYMQLKRRYQEADGSLFTPMVYAGPAYYNAEGYHKVEFEEIDSLTNDIFVQPISGGWAAVVQQYFMAALIPPPDSAARYYARTLSGKKYLIGYVTPAQTTANGAAHFSTTLFLGPKLQDRLAEVAPGLALAVDYGFLTIIAEPLFWLLDWIHAVVGNWGWAIVILTILIKAVFYKLSETSGRSMAKMRKVTPRMKTLKERYKDDRQKLNQAMMSLYKEEKINPASGCLPILVQMPVFIALYWVLLYSVELRQAPWILWINDLSSPDPYYVLPVLVGIAMFFQQKMNPPPADPMQAKIMMFMPVMFIAFSIFMPAGLVLYWFVNTLLSAAQQWQINRVVDSGARKKN
ncbi:MAG TPA: membrane protein insertase YidC [Gammaproteobacteria bacterium]|nr:membrane protein insertase YidC [Gammaproteobacteria bacterium]